jgi:DNA polymerase-4
MLRLRFEDSTRVTRSRTLPSKTARTRAILAAARELLEAAMPLIERRGCTLLGVTFSNLENDDRVQLALPLDPAEALDAALDEVRDRYGSKSITRAVLLHRDEGQSVPLLPD